jgi:GNAT superfamily N-acetyltransferase
MKLFIIHEVYYNLVGIHILIKEPSSENCIIKTLWLENKFRKQGIGSRLKQIGEEWAKTVGAQKMVTHVMSNNPAMFEMNKKKGFSLTKFEMEKPLI